MWDSMRIKTTNHNNSDKLFVFKLTPDNTDGHKLIHKFT